MLAPHFLRMAIIDEEKIVEGARAVLQPFAQDFCLLAGARRAVEKIKAMRLVANHMGLEDVGDRQASASDLIIDPPFVFERWGPWKGRGAQPYQSNLRVGRWKAEIATIGGYSRHSRSSLRDERFENLPQKELNPLLILNLDD